MEENNLQAYLRLLLVYQFSAAKLGTLLKQFSGLKAAAKAVQNDDSCGLSNFEKLALSESLATGIKQTANSNAGLEATLRWQEAADNHLICFESGQYPALLKEISCPPPLLYLRGNPGLLDSACCAMVGSRKASTYGLRNAKWLAHDLAEGGFTIVSGLAAGIDCRAHEGALHAKGNTIAVTGCGVDKIYPKQNRSLMECIVNRGAVVSEFPLGTEPRPQNFPRRNRIVSGLSLGVIVVEAALKSGSLITARLAMEQGRDVFAVPGAIGTSTARGCHQLITDGAALIESATDVAEILLNHWHSPGAEKPGLLAEPVSAVGKKNEPHNSMILDAIDEPACLLDTVAVKTGLSISEVRSAVLELELRGLLSMDGGRVSRC